MNEASKWRLELAQEIAPGYTENPKVAALVIAGSVGRGRADEYSDIEIDVWWNEPPTDSDRMVPIRRMGSTEFRLWPYESDEWSDAYDVSGVKIELSQFLVETMDRYIRDVVERYDTSTDKQLLISAIQHSIPLYGMGLVEEWRARVAHYPDALARAMVRENLDFGACSSLEMHASRGDLLVLYDLLCYLEKRVVGILHGLNRVYLSHPRGKWLDGMADEMGIAPPHLAARLKNIFELAPLEAVHEVYQLIEETISLVERHMPDVDTTEARRDSQARRRAIQPKPVLVSR